uniref:Uncharacterized protein n=1 Tax=uncultured Desulfobacterium sp. TaxID=201089 RepID=E1YL78_9BACT|nr:unknown protein [uncultured Desulfobacterium sp.]
MSFANNKFRIKENAGKIFLRVLDWTSDLMEKKPQGDFHQTVHLESNEIHSRKLWRLPSLHHAVYPGIQEGFVIQKTNLRSLEEDLQYFITNRPPKVRDAQSVLDRILLHRDTETGVFGIKDNIFHEDKVRYKSISGAMPHVSLLNIAWDCLSSPVFEQYWRGEPMNYRMQFWKDHLV